jgi:hypothetical protein
LQATLREQISTGRQYLSIAGTIYFAGRKSEVAMALTTVKDRLETRLLLSTVRRNFHYIEMVALSVFLRALKSGQTGSGKSGKALAAVTNRRKTCFRRMFAEHPPTSLMHCKYTPAAFRAASG